MYMDSIKKIKKKGATAASKALTFAKENKAFMFKLGLMAAVVAMPDVGFCNSASNIQVTPLQKPVQMFLIRQSPQCQWEQATLRQKQS